MPASGYLSLMLLLAALALATPLDISTDRALDLIEACEGGDAPSCAAMAGSARRAWAQSKVDEAWNNAESAEFRWDQMASFLVAGCEAGDIAACRNAGRDNAACRLGDDESCSTLFPTPDTKSALEARCADAPGGRACALLREVGWKDGPAWRVTIFEGNPGVSDLTPRQTRFADPEGRGYVVRDWTPMPNGLYLASAVRGDVPVLAWCDPGNGTAGTLADLPFSPEALAVSPDGTRVAWSTEERVERARLVDGSRLEDVERSMVVPHGESGSSFRLAVATDGRVVTTQAGHASLWNPAADRWSTLVDLGSATEVAILGDGRIVTVEGSYDWWWANVHVFAPRGAPLGRIRVPADDGYVRVAAVSLDRTSLLLDANGYWVELDFSERPAPAWTAEIPTEAPRTGRVVRVLDSAGIPIAGLRYKGWQGSWTDLSGRGAVGAQATVGGGGDGLEATIIPDVGVMTVRTWAEKRARMAAIGPGVTAVPEGGALRVTAVDPDGTWAHLLNVGDVLSAPGALSVDALWGAAVPGWPIEGIEVTRNGAVLVLPGGGRCVSPNAPPAAVPATMSATHASRYFHCPDPAAVGTHVQHLSEAEWAAADLVSWLDGNWVPLRTPFFQRLQAGLRSADRSPEPAVAVEVEALRALPVAARAQALEKWRDSFYNSFRIRVRRQLTWRWHGFLPDRITARDVGGIVEVRGAHLDNLTFIDHDTLINESGYIFVRVAE